MRPTILVAFMLMSVVSPALAQNQDQPNILTSELTEFLGWTLVVNFGVLILAFLMLTLMRNTIAALHSKMFGLSEEDLSRAYLQYMAQYKIAIFVFNLAPYIALKLMA